MIVSAVEGSAVVLPDIVSLAAVEIAVRHRLLEGQLFQPILAILQTFNAGDSIISESQLISLPLLHQCLTTCTLFDNLPSSIIEHLLRIRCRSRFAYFPPVTCILMRVIINCTLD